MLTGQTPERRLPDNRLFAPDCPNCSTAHAVAVVSRADYAVYFRCAGCGWVAPVRKPHPVPLGE